MAPIVAYADTSVYGGVFDDEFSKRSRRFFELVGLGRFALLVSDVVRQEVSRAPAEVQTFLERLLPHMRLVRFDERVMALRDAYVAHKIVSARWADDAAHVATATVGDADLIVSWNFRHIVHLDRIRRYNAVNALCGYGPVEIRSPAEVIEYGDEDETD